MGVGPTCGSLALAGSHEAQAAVDAKRRCFSPPLSLAEGASPHLESTCSEEFSPPPSL
jgi:hypothetical protein